MKHLRYILFLILSLIFFACNITDPIPAFATRNIYRIYSINLDGSNLKLIANGNYFSLLPNGKLIYTNNYKMYSCNSDGSHKMIISPSNLDVEHYQFHPNKGKIIFLVFANSGCIPFKMDIDGSGLTQLSSTIISNGWPVISPDESKVAFLLNSALYIRDIDGSNSRQITDTTSMGYYWMINFTPDGKNIIYLYISNYDFQRDLRLYNIDTKFDTSLFYRAKYGINAYCVSKWNTLLFFDGDGINLENINTHAYTFLHPGEDPQFSYDSTKVTFIQSALHYIDVMNLTLDSTKVIKVLLPGNSISHPILSLDEKRVFFQADSSWNEY